MSCRLNAAVAALVAAAMVSTTERAHAQYGAKIAAYCAEKIDKQVGAGECAHLAIEALRVAGADFIRDSLPDHPQPGDYTWGERIKYLSFENGRLSDSHPASKSEPGDLLQSRLGNSGDTHHTAVVASVDEAGYPTFVYQQNFNSRRVVSRDPIDLQQLLKTHAGYVQIFRAKSPPKHNRIEFCLVNRAHDAEIEFQLGPQTSSIGPKDSAGGFLSAWMSGKSTLTLNGATYTVRRRKTYEFYSANDTVKLRMLNP